MDPTHPVELYLQKLTSSPEQVSNLNANLISEIEFSELREFNFRARDGQEVHGFFMPSVAKQNEKPSCIVEIHGGGGTEGYRFMFEFQCLAAQGYSVVACNFRGTAGYGEDFMKVLTGHYMEKDFSDIIDMVEHLVKSGWIDERRIGVTGGSYGGYLTNWAVSHSKLFAAAVTDRSVVNLFSFYGTSDDYRLIEEDVQESFPWVRPEHYLAKSPISYTKDITTPLLIMHSEEDFRCRLEQAEQLYAFLKRQGKEVVFAVFPGESHGLSRGGKPHHRVERLQLMLWWFTSHIKTGEIAVERPI
jgi:dipeptidyl aminopeptidase/acylaminoacyl peptidase